MQIICNQKSTLWITFQEILEESVWQITFVKSNLSNSLQGGVDLKVNDAIPSNRKSIA
jgi:hypothetical protein